MKTTTPDRLHGLRKCSSSIGVRRIEPAEVAWAGILATVAAVDVALLRADHLPLSTVCRRSKLGRAAVVLLAAHLIASIPGDPFTLLGRRITRAGASG